MIRALIVLALCGAAMVCGLATLTLNRAGHFWPAVGFAALALGLMVVVWVLLGRRP